jgi:hypothetical protein
MRSSRDVPGKADENFHMNIENSERGLGKYKFCILYYCYTFYILYYLCITVYILFIVYVTLWRGISPIAVGNK